MELGLWYGSILDIPDNFVEELYEYTQLMEHFVTFTPRIVTFECPNCVGEVRDRECLSNGLYCLTPPKDQIGKFYPQVTDHQLLMENLRSKCVHIVTKKDTSVEPDDLRFFNYLYNMRIDCTHGKQGITTWCSDDVLKAINVDVSAVDRCVDNSFKEPGNETSGNELLFEDKLLAEVYGISRHPALTING